MVRRFDAGTLKAQKDPVTGFLQGVARITRTGVFTYRNADGALRKELRHPDHVFKADSLATFALKPITLDHHTGELVTADNARDVQIGSLGDSVRRDGKFVVAPYVITDAKAIKQIEAGKQQLSCGYNCDLDWTPGVYDGEQYDCVQTNIQGNHLSVLDRGRAGPEVRIDGDDAFNVDDINGTSTRNDAQEAQHMETITINGVTFEVSKQVAQAFRAEQKRADEALQAEKVRADTAIADVTKLTARADAADATIKQLREDNTPEKQAEKIKARVDLVTKATEIMGSDFKCDALDDDAIKRAVITKAQPSIKLDGKDSVYVNASFDTVIALRASGTSTTNNDAAAASAAGVRKAVADATNNDGADDDADAAYKRMCERNRKAWQPDAK